MGCAWRETNVEDTDLEAVIQDLLEGQYSNPVRVVGFNLSEGWVRDVSEEIALRLCQRCADEDRELPDSLHQLVENGSQNLGRKVFASETAADMSSAAGCRYCQRHASGSDRSLTLVLIEGTFFTDDVSKLRRGTSAGSSDYPACLLVPVNIGLVSLAEPTQ